MYAPTSRRYEMNTSLLASPFMTDPLASVAADSSYHVSGRPLNRGFQVASGVERREALGFLVELPLRVAREPLERFRDDPPTLGTPRPCDRAVDEERSDRMRSVRREDPR